MGPIYLGLVWGRSPPQGARGQSLLAAIPIQIRTFLSAPVGARRGVRQAAPLLVYPKAGASLGPGCLGTQLIPVV
jgi:hypothetical protein